MIILTIIVDMGNLSRGRFFCGIMLLNFCFCTFWWKSVFKMAVFAVFLSYKKTEQKTKDISPVDIVWLLGYDRHKIYA